MDYPSIWKKGTAMEIPREPLSKKTDVLIIGSGLCGLLTAWRLWEKGVTEITVVDAGALCDGISAHTTGKITAQHGLIYDKLIRGLGREKAWQFASANQNAVSDYATMIKTLELPCQFTPATAALYTTLSSGKKALEQEMEACLRVGLPVKLSQQTELPFPVAGALFLQGGAHFHPLQFAYALIGVLRKRGVRFFPYTKVAASQDDWQDGLVQTDQGSIKAETVIVATHFPFLDKPGFYFARVWQERAYVLAIEQTPPLENMYLGIDETGYSFRPYANGLLVTGSNHKSGHEGRAGHFQQLEAITGVWYPTRHVAAQWSAQDCMTHDGIPYIGRYRQAEGKSGRVYVATGFNKWGMSSSMVAAHILSDAILRIPNEYADVFSPSRFNPVMKTKSFVTETTDMLTNYIGGYVNLASTTVDTLPPGEGKLLVIDGEKVGAFRDTDGTVYTVNPICTHMGCVLEWNRDENSWDCPCHGSRYSYKGYLLNGPAPLPLTSQISE